MSKKLRIALAQINSSVGGIEANSQKIIEFAEMAKAKFAADLIVFPELAVSGYPPEDLLFREEFLEKINQHITLISQQVKGLECILGAPVRSEGKLYNSAVLASNGVTKTIAHKQILPNYGVFDEKRYFAAGQTSALFEVAGYRLGVTICEDAWESGPIQQACEQGAQAIININASPYHMHKLSERYEVLKMRCQEVSLPIFYAHMVGGQDELVFDGASFVCDANGDLVCQAQSFEEALPVIELEKDKLRPINECGSLTMNDSEVSRVYQALVLAVRDYVSKNGFNGAVIGLSGGVDSALTLAIAADALGPENVEAVMMPSRFTSQMSLQDAEQLAQNYRVMYETISIEPAFQAMLDSLKDVFAGLPLDTTEENIQARCRGVLLMAISNKKKRLVLATGNKSEMSVGYATLYGDMAGGFAPLKDVSKTLVYQLCEYINRNEEKIPTRILTRAPSAELAENQQDQDSLPDYAQLDRMLELYIEQGCSVEEIASEGFDRHVVQDIVRKVNLNEYKRRQAAPGVKITKCAFGRERRYPITSAFDKSSTD